MLHLRKNRQLSTLQENPKFTTDKDILLLTYLLEANPHLVELLGDFFPVHHAGLDEVVELEDDESITQVAVQVVDVGRHTHTVHPVTEHC